MRAPDFWYREGHGRDAAPILRAALAPVAALYGYLGARRIAQGRPTSVGAPVVCVGNLTLGGAGKTPVARTLRAMLGPGAHMLSRGYGGRAPGPLQVTPDADAADVGDEPLLHARDGPAWVSRDRVAGAQAAVAAGARVIVMDDGFQNPDLKKDVSILVVDAAAGIGNGKVFPAGPLREPAAAGLARADAVVLLRAAETAPDESPQFLENFGGPVLRAWIEPTAPPPPGRLLAFAGIGRPEKFFDTLSAHGGEVVDGASFPDHHRFALSELERLADYAASIEATLVTTEKDAVRLPAAWRERVAVFPIAARFAEPDVLARILAQVVSAGA